MPEIVLTYDYGLPLKTVYDWWTDLSGKGYVGKSLKSLQQVGKDGNKILVETKWRVMGMNMKMVEGLTIESATHWTWKPHMMGIQIVDDFRLENKDSVSRLHISSEFHPLGMKGRLSQMMFGSYLRKLMTDEWDSADKAFRLETRSGIQNAK